MYLNSFCIQHKNENILGIRTAVSIQTAPFQPSLFFLIALPKSGGFRDLYWITADLVSKSGEYELNAREVHLILFALLVFVVVFVFILSGARGLLKGIGNIT